MSIPTIQGRDYTGSQLPASPIPGVQLASYITGSAGIVMSAAQEAAHPGIIRIDQSPVNTALDETADVLDFENRAALLSDLATWTVAANSNFDKGVRPGQRRPCIYMSRSNVTPVVNALIAGGVQQCNLWVASWGVQAVVAEGSVANASGPFPIVGFQYSNAAGTYDDDFFSQTWLADVSKAPVTPPPPPPVDSTETVTLKSLVVTVDGKDYVIK